MMLVCQWCVCRLEAAASVLHMGCLLYTETVLLSLLQLRGEQRRGELLRVSEQIDGQVVWYGACT